MLLEPIINTHKVKYKILKDLMETIDLSKRKTDNINIFINLDSVLKGLYGGNLTSVIRSLNSEERVTITSEISNLGAHYRRFFWTRYQIKTTFYFYYMNKKPKGNMELYPDYAKSLLEKKSNKNAEFAATNKTIKDNLRLFTLLSIYIPKFYFVLSDGLEPGLIPYHFIKKADKEDINLVLTKDPYEFQLISRPNTYILRLQYDNSALLTRDNLIEYLLKKNKYKPDNHIDGKYYENILPLIACKSRDVKSLKGMGQVAMIKKLDKHYADIDPDMSYSLLLDTIGVDIEDEEIMDRYKFMNIKYQYKKISKLEKMRMEEFVEDKYENRTIMDINSKYFPYNPIQLVELYDGIDMYQQ